MKSVTFCLEIGETFSWFNGNIDLYVIAIPTGWQVMLSDSFTDKLPAMNAWQVPDKEHLLNPLSLWNPRWGVPKSHDPSDLQRVVEEAFRTPTDYQDGVTSVESDPSGVEHLAKIYDVLREHPPLGVHIAGRHTRRRRLQQHGYSHRRYEVPRHLGRRD